MKHQQKQMTDVKSIIEKIHEHYLPESAAFVQVEGDHAFLIKAGENLSPDFLTSGKKLEESN